MQTSKIRQMSKYHGFGFIKSNNGKDFFFRRTDIRGVSFHLLEEGQSVKFNVGWGSKGFQARNVELIKEEVKNVLEKENSN